MLTRLNARLQSRQREILGNGQIGEDLIQQRHGRWEGGHADAVGFQHQFYHIESDRKNRLNQRRARSRRR
jgi:hypothetical protein